MRNSVLIIGCLSLSIIGTSYAMADVSIQPMGDGSGYDLNASDASSFRTNNGSDVTFTFGSANGVGSNSDGIFRRDPSDIIKVGDTWHVWYSSPEGFKGGPSTIWHATSTDSGVNWTEEGMAVPRGNGTWDADSAFTPNILLHDNVYYLYYTGVGPNYWTTSGYHEDQKFRIGVASADSPYGPWTKHSANPILEPSSDLTKFDSFRTDDSALMVRDGKIWLYHKGRQWGQLPTGTKMGVLVADHPLGPFVRQNDGDPVQLGGHEVQIWAGENESVYSLVGSVGPNDLKYTIRYSADGINFDHWATMSPAYPVASGMYRTDLTDPTAVNGHPEWGLYGVTQLDRFDTNFPASGSDAYGVDGYYFFGNGVNKTSNANNMPSWVSSVNAANEVVVLATYTDFDNPAEAMSSDVTDWTSTGITLTTPNGPAGMWSELLSFTVNELPEGRLRIGVMAGNEQSANGRWDPTGLRISFNGERPSTVSDLNITDLGMVFFDVDMSDVTSGTFSIEGQKRLRTQGPTVAGITLDLDEAVQE